MNEYSESRTGENIEEKTNIFAKKRMLMAQNGWLELKLGQTE